MCCDQSFIGAQVSGGQKEEQTVGITKHLWGLSSSIRAKSCPPSPFRVAGATGGPVVIVLPLSRLPEMWDWEKQLALLPLCLILTKPIPLLLLKAAVLGGLSLCTLGASPGFVPHLLQAGDTGRERRGSQVVW